MKLLPCILIFIPTVRCFGISRLSPRSLPSVQTGTSSTVVVNIANDDNQGNETLTASPWRIVLDIGREPLATMPFKWARSGTRMPLVIPCDILPDETVVPRSDTVSFTGPEGAVVKPIQGGPWELSKNGNEIFLSFTFPEYVEKGDVYIEAGSTLTLQAAIFTKDELEKRDKEFNEAREETWKIGGELNEMGRQQGASKKWNEEKQVWEKSNGNGVSSLFTQVQKRISLIGAQAKQKQSVNQRVDRNTLSDRGSFPGFESVVFIQQQGIAKVQKNEKIGSSAVIGKWSAEPINF